LWSWKKKGARGVGFMEETSGTPTGHVRGAHRATGDTDGQATESKAKKKEAE
jgi:hypothetical protein